MLTLKKKIITSTGEYYVFLDGNTVKKLSWADSILLIKQYNAKERNCKVVSGEVISLKQNEGNLLVEKIQDKFMRKGVYLYTKKKYKSECLIDSNDSWFNKTSQDMAFLMSCKEYILRIDHAKIIDKSMRKIETPFGICSVDDFSTGLKTLINILYLLKQKSKDIILINASECGDIVMGYIFKLVNNSRISLYLSHDVLEMPEIYEYYVNDKKLDDVLDFVDYIEG